MTADWCAFHLHYHGDLDRLLVEVVRPLLVELAVARRIEGAFFVRYALGGPHVRLRLRLPAGEREAARGRITALAEDFFRRTPSSRSLPEEEIRRINAAILATDPHERDDAVYPDGAVREAPFAPEIDRYGGAELLPSSLEAFVLSSARALRFVKTHAGSPRGRQLPWMLRLLVGEALGLATDGEELLALLAAPFEGRAAMAPLVERGDRLFEERRDFFSRLLGADLEAQLAGGSPLGALDPGEAARALAAVLASASPAVRRRVASSQLHMSANRLGLGNAEEVYLGRVAWLAVRACLAESVALRERIGRGEREAREDAERRLREGARAALGGI